MMLDQRYPIGPFDWHETDYLPRRGEWLSFLAAGPDYLRTVCSRLGDDGIDEPYRPGGWTVRQIVHHVADTSMQGFLLTKRVITEACPRAEAPNEALCATLPDTRESDIGLSLDLLDALHPRWVALLKSLQRHEWTLEHYHPHHGRVSLVKAAAWHAWHIRHHGAQIQTIPYRRGAASRSG
jgi:hypothetical protein